MLFENSNKVRRGFLTHRTTINHNTRGKPLRLQKLSFLIGLAKLGTPLGNLSSRRRKHCLLRNVPFKGRNFLVSYFVDI